VALAYQIAKINVGFVISLVYYVYILHSRKDNSFYTSVQLQILNSVSENVIKVNHRNQLPKLHTN